jgi:hypothetical protein
MDSKHKTLAALAMSGALLVAACSGGSGKRSETTTTTTTRAMTRITSTTPVVTEVGECEKRAPMLIDYYEGDPRIHGLATTFIPIDAAKVRLCRYSRAGGDARLVGSALLADDEAARFERETNRLPTIATKDRQPIPCPLSMTAYYLVFARGQQRVHIYDVGCSYITNGPLLARMSPSWIDELRRLTPR